MPTLEAQATEYGFYFQVEIKKSDGSPLDLLGGVITLRVSPKGITNGAKEIGTSAISGLPADGIVRTSVAAGELVQGFYDAQYKIDFPTRRILTKTFILSIGRAI